MTQFLEGPTPHLIRGGQGGWGGGPTMTLHPLAIYYKDADGNLQHYSLCFISDDNTHDTGFVHKIQTLLVEFLKHRLPNITKIYYISDVCGGQYKNFKNFLNLCSHKEDFSIEAEWIFFATSYRKSLCDGIGGAVKCHAAKWNLQRPLNNQILDYHRDYFRNLGQCLKDTKKGTFSIQKS